MQALKWLYPGMKIKRWLLLFSAGLMAVSLAFAILFGHRFIGAIEDLVLNAVGRLTGERQPIAVVIAAVFVLGLGLAAMAVAVRQTFRSVAGVFGPEHRSRLVDIIYQKRLLERGPSIAVIGGGTGLAVLLRGIKNYTSNITAIVTVADNGGSSGRIREDLGVIPPGDLRNCLVALADTEPLMEKLFQHRFGGSGSLSGHSFGNLFLAAMMEVLGDAELALKESSKVLAVRGQVLPSTAETVHLVAEMTDGTVVEGESQIPLANKAIRRVFIRPEDPAPVEAAIEAILEADVVVLGPGSLYTSVLPNLLVGGIVGALRRTAAIRLYVCNVMTQPGETDGYTASRHIKAIIDHVGPGIIDYAVVNTQSVAPALQEHYARQGACPVVADVAAIEALGIKVITADLISETNLVRHDPFKLAGAIIGMVKKHSGEN